MLPPPHLSVSGTINRNIDAAMNIYILKFGDKKIEEYLQQ